MTRKKSEPPTLASRQLQLDALFETSKKDTEPSPTKSHDVATATPPVFTVSELIADVNQRLRGAYGRQVWVEGELGQVGEKNGVYYFSIKDAKASLECVLFRRHIAPMFELKQGVFVLVRGYLEIYSARGKFTLVVESVEPRGEGALLLAFLQLKKKLEAEGLFAKPKRHLPVLPRVVGVVTSESGAALQDILKIARKRVGCHILLSDCLVQGTGAPLSIIAALKLIESRADVEVIILARGGGSLEDLACFNDEGVVRAVHACRVPIVTAIGHQTDTTLVDFVSDVRAATPTEAAEMVFADAQLLSRRIETVIARCTRAVSLSMERAKRILAETRLPEPQIWLNRKMRDLAELQIQLDTAVRRKQDVTRMQMDALVRRLDRLSPHVQVLEQKRRLYDVNTRLKSAITLQMHTRSEKVARLTERLEALSVLAVLQRGFAIVTSADGRFVRDATQLCPGDSVDIRFARGFAHAIVDRITADNKTTP